KEQRLKEVQLAEEQRQREEEERRRRELEAQRQSDLEAQRWTEAVKPSLSELDETAENRTLHISSGEKSAPVSAGLNKVDEEAAKISDVVPQSPNMPTSNILKRFKLGKSIQSLSLFPRSIQRKKIIVILISLLLVTAVFFAMLLSRREGTDGENRIREL